MRKLPLYKKILSYIYPIQLRKSSGKENPFLELLFYRGQYQLATEDALYSDGDRYTPLTIAFKHIGRALANVDSVLVLGTGIGSAVQILTKKGYTPQYTLVEYDETVLTWAMEVLPKGVAHIHTVCADARVFMSGNAEKYDLVIVDIFNSRVVPGFVTTDEFMKQCRSAMNSNGYLVFNYIIQSKDDWQPVDKLLRSIFTQCYSIDNGLNRIVVAKA